MKVLSNPTNETRTIKVSEDAKRPRSARPKPHVSNAFLETHVLPYSEDASDFIDELVREVPTWADRLKYHSAAERAGLLVRAMREVAGLSQASVEKETQIRQSEISSIENGMGEKGPTYDVISRMADACGFYLTFAPKAAPASTEYVFPNMLQQLVSPANCTALVEAICTVLVNEGVVAKSAAIAKTQRAGRNNEHDRKVIELVQKVLTNSASATSRSRPARLSRKLRTQGPLLK